MNREEILKAAQSEAQDTGEYERNVARKAIMYGAASGVMLCTIMSVVELWIFKKIDFGKPAMLFAISGFALLYEGIKGKDKKKFIGGLSEMFISVFCLFLYIGALFL